MPSFASALNDQEKWDVSALLARVDKLPAEAQEALKPAPEALAAPSASVKIK
jgi:hypothetical protein